MYVNVRASSRGDDEGGEEEEEELNPADDLHGLIAAAGSSSSRRPNRDRTMMMMITSSESRGSCSINNNNNNHHEEEEEEAEELKARIASHPRYPTLLQAYINCRKVGAPPEVASLLEEIRQNNTVDSRRSSAAASDPELDHFMETFCNVLVKYRADLVRPMDEATAFINDIETQLSHLCNHINNNSLLSFSSSATNFPLFISADETAGLSEDESSGGETEIQESHPRDENRDLKNRLLRKYSGYLSTLKQEFSKKKKRGKLPKEARQTLLQWWSSHYKWPYPTEADKISLAEMTGLDQKQINNWFINQRKRHWKPSESMQFSVMAGLSAPFYDG